MKLSILYRGPLSSCNYDCGYCPFAKRQETKKELELDRAALQRFVGWVGANPEHGISVLFTPWGEALVRRWYQDALADLTHLAHVRKAAIQTNLSAPIAWVDGCRMDRLAIWATFHPGQTTLEKFTAKIMRLHERGVRLSAGIVGKLEHFAAAAQLRARLPHDVYLWINAHQGRSRPYSNEEVNFLTSIDPWFPLNLARHRSRGEPCRAGESAFAVDGDGNMRRCHFVSHVIGNIYSSDWEQALCARPCPKATCSCHIGYIFLPRLRLEAVFGEATLERIPLAFEAPHDTSLIAPNDIAHARQNAPATFAIAAAARSMVSADESNTG